MLISVCESDQTYNNYNGQVLDNSHSIVGNETSDGDKPIIVIHNPTDGTIVIKEPNSDDNTNHPSVYTSTKTKSFKRNCGTGFTGTLVPYTVTYNSLISQLDADARASSKLELEGQANANVIGICQCALVFVQPTLTYTNDSVKARLVITNALEYKLGTGNWQIENEFIITQDGDYTFYARNGVNCQTSGQVVIRINPENDIFDIKFVGSTCDADSPTEPIITDIKLVAVSCENNTNEDISNIRFVEQYCDINQSANIDDIKLVKAC